MLKLTFSALGASLLTALALAQPSGQPVMVTPEPDDTVVVYNIDFPAWASLGATTTSIGSGGSFSAYGTLGATANVGQDAFIVEFRLSNGYTVISTFGSAELPGRLNTANRTMLIRNSDGIEVASGLGTLNGSLVNVSLSHPLLIGASVLGYSTRYAPANIVSTDGFRVLTELEVTSVATAGAVSSISMGRAINGIPVPADQYHVPPVATDLLDAASDINGDGILDYNYQFDQKLPDTNMIVDLRGLRRSAIGPSVDDEFYLVIGTDLNFNNKLETGEITSTIGRGFKGNTKPKYTYISMGKGKFALKWKAIDPVTGKTYTFIFIAHTGTLKVFDENGNLIYIGPPGAYPHWGK